MSVTGTFASGILSRLARPFTSPAGMPRSYAVIILAVYAVTVFAALQNYRAIDRELTDVALSRRAAVAQLAASTLSEKFARLVDISISLATRVRFRELVSEGIVQGLLRGEHGVQIGFDRLEREDQISAYAPVSGYGWGVITQQPTRASLGLEARDSQLRLLLTACGLFLLLCASAIYFAAHFSLPREKRNGPV